MAVIFQAGSLNTTAFTVPNLYVEIVPPSILALNGVPSNLLGVVGTASWGPVSVPVQFGSYAGGSTAFGPLNARTFDLLTPIYVAQQQGASAFIGVRVTDGTDTKATAQFEANSGDTAWGANITALYTGVVGNGITVTIQTSGKGSGYMDALVSCPTLGIVEQFIAIPNTSPSTFWPALTAALSTGSASGWTANRGASRLVVLSVGTADTTVAPVSGSTITLAGGTDGALNVSASTLIGVDGTARTGMYSLRGQGASAALLADNTTPSTWSTQVAFGLSEGVYMIATGPQGDNIANAVATLQSAGATNYALKVMFGDWLAWADPVNNVTRLVSPQGYVGGLLANLSPEQSSLNKELYGIVYSQRSGASTSQTGTYAQAELQQLFAAGIDVICNPQPGGSYWGVRGGFNTSGTPTTYLDSYTRLTNYLSQTLAAGMGGYVGQLINPTLFVNITSTLLGFLGNLLGQGVLVPNADGSAPYAVLCNASNNPQSRTQLGYVTAAVQVTYPGINMFFTVALQGGQTIVTSSATQQATGLNGVAAA